MLVLEQGSDYVTYTKGQKSDLKQKITLLQLWLSWGKKLINKMLSNYIVNALLAAQGIIRRKEVTISFVPAGFNCIKSPISS